MALPISWAEENTIKLESVYKRRSQTLLVITYF